MEIEQEIKIECPNDAEIIDCTKCVIKQEVQEEELEINQNIHYEEYIHSTNNNKNETIEIEKNDKLKYPIKKELEMEEENENISKEIPFIDCVQVCVIKEEIQEIDDNHDKTYNYHDYSDEEESEDDDDEEKNVSSEFTLKAIREKLQAFQKNEVQQKQISCEKKTLDVQKSMDFEKEISKPAVKFVCEICFKGFVLLSFYKLHMKLHGEAPIFTCEVCNETYKQKGHLTLHKQIHTEEKLFPCLECPVRFSKKAALDNHIKIVHPKKRGRTQGRKNTTEEERGQIIGMYKSGATISKISRELQMDRKTIRNWIKRYNETCDLRSLPKSGRPKTTSKTEDQKIIQHIKQNPFATATSVLEKLELNCSEWTVRRRLHEAGVLNNTPSDTTPVKESIKKRLRETRGIKKKS